jgi:hypothetical protein
MGDASFNSAAVPALAWRRRHGPAWAISGPAGSHYLAMAGLVLRWHRSVLGFGGVPPLAGRGRSGPRSWQATSWRLAVRPRGERYR